MNVDATGRSGPLFSIVIPVFNGEEFVSEAIESVLDQSLGLGAFEIVVVDDGSTDTTPLIVDGFARRFPLNMTVVRQSNQGVSAALNAGVQVAAGDVIGFVGADDWISADALELVAQFFREHGDECELAAIPIFMFGARSGPHPNNRNRFSKTRVIDVKREWNLAQTAGGGTFVKASALKETNLQFDERLFIAEDLTLNTQIILRTMKYGAVGGAKYFNRRYPVGGSLVSSSHFRKEFYSDILQFSHQRILDYGRELHGKVPLYAQAMVARDLTWRFRGDRSVMEPDMEPLYREALMKLLRQIEVKVILAQRAPIEVRLSMLNVREGGRLRERITRKGLTYWLEACEVYSLKKKPGMRQKPVRCDINFFEVTGDEVEIQGRFRVPDIDDLHFSLEAGGRSYPVERLIEPPSTTQNLAQDVRAAVPFRVTVKMMPNERLRPVVVLTDTNGDPVVVPVVVLMHPFSRFSGNADVGYFRRDGRTVFRRAVAYSIDRRYLSLSGVVRAELGFMRQASRAGAAPSQLGTRVAVIVRQAISGRQTWLIGDHKSEAGDNGEAMFRHLASLDQSGVKPCFVLRKDAKGYANLRRLGKVVEPNSRAHLRKFIDAAVVMNSSGDSYMTDPLPTERRTFINDLIRHQSVFLQHGVILGDLSGWLNRWNKGFDLFVTSAPRERKSILEGGYGYSPDEVVLTGLPRFDRLENSPEKLVVFAPTWRKNLSGDLDASTGRVGKSTLFSKSDYFSLWQQAVLDPRLNTAMSQLGYRGIFVLHPSHASEVSSFQSSQRIRIDEFPHDYEELFRSGGVLVTDYSSVAFDFAYLRKPVVYIQGDRDQFFGTHLYSKGYFSYEEDGFGPVVETVEGLVDALIELFDQSSAMDEKYRTRADNFFAHSGGGNSERLREVVVAKLEG